MARTIANLPKTPMLELIKRIKKEMNPFRLALKLQFLFHCGDRRRALQHRAWRPCGGGGGGEAEGASAADG